MPRWRALIGVGGFALIAAVTGAGYDRWRCPSQTELERARSTEEVVAAFADEGVRLQESALPAAVVGDDRAYRGARAYSYETGRAGLYVLVCRRRCASAPRGLRDDPIRIGGPRRHVRQFSSLGNNIGVFVTDDDGRSARALQARVQPVLDELDTAVPSDSHCYVQ